MKLGFWRTYLIDTGLSAVSTLVLSGKLTIEQRELGLQSVAATTAFINSFSKS